MKIVITGSKCSGKSTVGKELADKLNIPFYETDEIIENMYANRVGSTTRLSCRSICNEIGDDNFRTLEKEAIKSTEELDWCVISTGGSTMLNSENRKSLRRNSFLTLIYANAQTLVQRLQKMNIPSFLNNSTAISLFTTRATLVKDVTEPYADFILDSSTMDINSIVDSIIFEIESEMNIRNSKPNSFGKTIKLTTFGESHGKALGAVLDGVQPGIEISEEIIQLELDRRKPGQSKITTARAESDKIEILSGVFEGKTTGAPIGMIIRNKDQDSSKYDNLKDLFRPGTADFTFWNKYAIRDHRGAGRASGRETASRVMAGAIAKDILNKEYGIDIIAHTISIGNIKATKFNSDDIEKNNVRCGDSKIAALMEEHILELKSKGDSTGGVVQVNIKHLPIGIGDPVFGKLDARLGYSILTVGAIKAIEFGNGFETSKLAGSQNNDSIENGKFNTNNAGGILGGISNGEDINIKIAIKPTPSIYQEQKTINKQGDNVSIAIEGRHDPCIVPRVIPVIESMVAITLLDAIKMNEAIKRDK